jgi:hypothetical protein
MNTEMSKVLFCEITTDGKPDMLRVMPTDDGQWVLQRSERGAWQTPTSQVSKFPGAQAAMEAYDAICGPQKWDKMEFEQM